MSEKKPLWKNSVFLTFTAMLVGTALGMIFGETMTNFKFIGSIWLNCLKMILVPMVFCTMTLAVGSQKDLRTLGRVALRILIYYMLTTAIACAVGLGTSFVTHPGRGMSLEGFTAAEISGSSKFTLANFFSSLFSDGLFGTFASANMIQTIVISIVLGASILGMKNEEHRKGILNALQAASEWINVYLGAVIKLSPIGVLFLMADSFGQYGMVLLTGMFKLVLTFWLAVIMQILLVYCSVLWFTAGVSPVKFIRDSMQVWSFTIATCSSVANIPNSVDCAEKKFGVPSYIANFGIPLGAQINYDGSAILYGCVLYFMSEIYGFSLSPAQLLQIIVVSTLISSAGGGIPGSNLVKMMVVVNTFGLPGEIVGIIAGFYRLFDMGTTTGNCLGDLAGTVAVANWEKRRAARLGTQPEEELHI